MTSATPVRGGDVVDAYLTTDPEETDPMQPLRWTSIDTLETDPSGFPPVPAEDQADPEAAPVEPVAAAGGVGPINQEQQAPEAPSPNGVLGRLRDRRRRARSHRAEGLTRRVWRSSAAAAEASRLADVVPMQVIRQEAANSTAARLETLAQDPAAEAHANRRARRLFLGMAFAGIALGVLISATTAQTTITSVMRWVPDSLPGLAAYGADPALGLVLFAVLGVRALAASRGVVLTEHVRRAFSRIELVLFALVAVLNVGPSAGALLGHAASGIFGISPFGSGDPDALGLVPRDVMVLVIHSLGPVLVAAGVWGVPYVLAVFGQISAATTARIQAAQQPGEPTELGALSLVDRRQRVPERFRGEFDVLASAIDAGDLAPNPSGAEIYRRLGGDAAKKAPLRDALAGYQPTGTLSHQ